MQQYSRFLVGMSRLFDGIIIFLSLYFLVSVSDEAWTGDYFVIALLGALFFEIIGSFSNLYRSWRVVRLRHELLKIFFYWTLTSLIISFVLFHSDAGINVRNDIISFWVFVGYFAIAVMRYFTRIFLRYFRAFGHDHKIAAFVGVSDVSIRLEKTFRRYPWMGIEIAGYYDDRVIQRESSLAIPQNSRAGTISDLVKLAYEHKVDAIYITLPMGAEKRIKYLIDQFSDTTVSIYYCPSFFEFDLLNTRWDDVFGQPVISVIESPFNGNVALVKRITDLILCLLIIPIIIVPMILVALAVKFTSPGPVLFKQKRYGLDGKEFKMWKFRSMYLVEKDNQYVQAKKNDLRVTSVGAFIRKTSMDELPQFINVLIGDMSVIGPRPHPIMLVEEHRKNIHRYMVRHKIRPGITGLAQVKGFRGETKTTGEMQKRFDADLEYMRHWSLWLDTRILFKTVRLVISDKNAY